MNEYKYIDNYISDNISDEEIKGWDGKNVMIIADTGLGKTTLIATNFAKQFSDREILYLCNRSFLKEQVLHDLNENKNILVMTYQYYEKNIECINEYIEQDYILVLDEAHYFCTDATFNFKLDILYKKIINSKNTKIFMTATPECLFFPNDFFECNYIFKRKLNDYIENCYFYYNEEILINKLKSIPDNEKALVIYNNIEKIEFIAEKLKNQVNVLVSKSKKNIYKKYNCEVVNKELVNNFRFPSKILLSTTCIDNGISLKMKELKHLIIAVSNPIEIKQIIGRKRFIDKDDKINIYLKYFNPKQLASELNRYKDLFEQGDFFVNNGQDVFISKYKTQNYSTNLIYPETEGNECTLRLNECLYNALLYKKQYIENMNENGYSNYVSGYLGIPFNRFRSLEHKHDFDLIASFILLHNEEKLFRNSSEYDELIDIFKYKLLFYKERTVGYSNVKKYIESMNTPDAEILFSVCKGRESKGENRSKVYWMLSEIDYKSFGTPT